MSGQFAAVTMSIVLLTVDIILLFRCKEFHWHPDTTRLRNAANARLGSGSSTERAGEYYIYLSAFSLVCICISRPLPVRVLTALLPNS